MSKLIRFGLLSLLFINVVYVFSGALHHPLQSMDAIGIWFLKAKAIYLENGFPHHFLHDPLYSYSHQQYPLGLPWLLSFFYQLSGGVNDQQALIIYPITYSAILLLTYFVLRRSTSPSLTLVITYFYSMFGPLLAGGGRILAGNADIFLLLIEWLILFLIYKQTLTPRRLFITVLLIMFASMIKSEGVFLAVILAFLPINIKPKLCLLAVSAIPFLAWQATVNLFQIPTDIYYAVPSFITLINKTLIIILQITKELFNFKNWYLFWPLFGLSLIINRRTPSLPSWVLPSWISIISLYLIIYLFSTLNPSTYVASSFDRILLQHSALAIIILSQKLTTIKHFLPVNYLVLSSIFLFFSLGY